MSRQDNYFIFLLVLISLAIISSCSKDDNNDNTPIAFGTVTDIDGNVYNTITIEIADGTLKSANTTQKVSQTWMVENLKTTKYRNGDPIPNITQGENWSSITTGACCHYDNDPNISRTYGLLYNWYAVKDSRNIAPDGWHVASESDWRTLIDFLGGLSVAGGKLKETGTSHWIKPNTGAKNSIGFTALPGGARWGGFGANGSFHVLDSCAYIWTSTADPADRFGTWAWRVGAYLTSSSITIADGQAENGFSIRCIKDY